MCTDSGELVKGTCSSNDSPVFDGNFPGNLNVVGDNNIVTDDGIMSKVGIGHQQCVVANLSDTFGCCTTVDSHILTYGGVIANLNRTVLAFKFQVLRHGGYHSTRDYLAILSDSGAWIYYNICSYPCSLTNDHIAVNLGKCFNGYTLSNNRLGMNFRTR